MISLNIATHKAREQSLKEVLKHVKLSNTTPDKVNIYLNDYDCPEWLKEYGYNVVEYPQGNLGASAKFYFTSFQKEGVYITLDDDLIPDKAYIGYLADMAYRYNSVVGLHGTIYHRHPVESYYMDKRREVLYCYAELTKDTAVDMLGTGALAFKIDEDSPKLSDFPIYNMTDPQLCYWAKNNQKTLVCLNRKAGFVKEIGSAQDVAIWKGLLNGDTKQTEVINSIKDFKRMPLPAKYPAEKLTDASIEWKHLKWIGSKITKSTKVVEIGSGMSTLYFQGLTDKLYSIEHNPKYHIQGKTHLRLLKDGWYDLNDYDWKHINEADIILIDGPIGSTGDRYNLPIEKLPKTATIFVDDCHREKDNKQAREISKHIGREIVYLHGKVKIMAKI